MTDWAVESQTIKHIIEDDCAADFIPLSNVTSKKASAAGESGSSADGEALKARDAGFFEVDQNTLFDLILIRENTLSVGNSTTGLEKLHLVEDVMDVEFDELLTEHKQQGKTISDENISRGLGKSSEIEMEKQGERSFFDFEVDEEEFEYDEEKDEYFSVRGRQSKMDREDLKVKYALHAEIKEGTDPESYYKELLQKALGSNASDAFISATRFESMDVILALLTKEEAEILSGMEGIYHVYPPTVVVELA